MPPCRREATSPTTIPASGPPPPPPPRAGRGSTTSRSSMGGRLSETTMMEDVRYALRQIRGRPASPLPRSSRWRSASAPRPRCSSSSRACCCRRRPTRPHRLVFLSPARLDGRPYTQGTTIGQWSDWRTSSRTIEPPALYRWTFNFLVLPDGSRVDRRDGRDRATSSRRWASGRSSAASSRARKPRGPRCRPTAVIIGHALWERQYNRDPEHHRQDAARSAAIRRRCHRRRHAARRALPARSRSVERAELRRERAGRLLPAVAPDETQPRSRGWNVVTPAARRRHAGAGAGARIARFTARQVQADTRLAGLTVDAAGARRAQSRRPQPAAAALRLRRARLLRGVRQRRGTVRRARAAAASRIRDAGGAGRVALATVPADDHRERGARRCSARSSAPAFAVGIVAVFKAIGDRRFLARTTCSRAGR